MMNNKIEKRTEIILLAHLNARITCKILNGGKNRFNEKVINENGKQLVQFCSQNESRINNTFYLHKPQHKYIFKNTCGYKSTIDYVITNRSIHPSRMLDVITKNKKLYINKENM